MTPAFTWQTEGGESAPSDVFEVDDALTADEALRRVRRGEALWHRGTFLNAKQLVAAMGRRLPKPGPAASALEAFRQERRARALEYETLSKVLVGVDGEHRLLLRRAPDVREACRHAWGPPSGALTLTPLKTLLGMLGAEAWRRGGLEVPGLRGTLLPAWGVYTPTRSEYVELLTRVDDVRGRTVFDVGTGSGVLSFVLLQRGAASVEATDVEPRAVENARENARRLGLEARFTVSLAPLFPPGTAELVVCNPPWLPEAPKSRFDRAVFDPDSAMLLGFLDGLRAHLAPGGRGLLILSNLAERLGLRAPGWLEAQLARCGLVVRRRHEARPSHGKAKDVDDPLHAARSGETTTLYELASSP